PPACSCRAVALALGLLLPQPCAQLQHFAFELACLCVEHVGVAVGLAGAAASQHAEQVAQRGDGGVDDQVGQVEHGVLLQGAGGAPVDVEARYFCLKLVATATPPPPTMARPTSASSAQSGTRSWARVGARA